jgi:hypothetical protein
MTSKSWTLYLVFDKPISIKQFRIDGSGATLPLHEVKDYGERHAVIQFGEEDLVGVVLSVQVAL